MSKDDMTQHEARKYLAAFADGELDVEQNLKVLGQMAMDPTNTRRVLHQQQLRKACAEAMDGPEHRCPDELRTQISDLLDAEGPRASSDADAKPRSGAGSPVIARIGHWLPAAVAAVLLLGATAVCFSPRVGDAGGSGAIVTAGQFELFNRRHSSCSKDLTKLYAGIQSPTDVAALPGTIDDYFGDTAGSIDSALDLSVLGYDFQRVGLCSIPGKGAVHVVYRAAEGADDRSLSLWIKPDQGDLPITADMMHTARSADGKPVLIWKHNGRVYYLFGDQTDDAAKAAELLAGVAPASSTAP